MPIFGGTKHYVCAHCGKRLGGGEEWYGEDGEILCWKCWKKQQKKLGNID